jgi:serine/threonine-protein kinase HipA
MSKKFIPLNLINIFMDFGGHEIRLGRIFSGRQGYAFEFDSSFPVKRMNPSPFKLVPQAGSTIVHGPSGRSFEGLHGIFSDSLPDGWGRLLMDRKLRSVGIDLSAVTMVDRLAWMGGRGMGALVYRPERDMAGRADDGAIDLDGLHSSSLLVLRDSPREALDRLLELGGSPGGARPKVLVGVREDKKELSHGAGGLPAGFDHWLVKFRTGTDSVDAGAVEFAYSVMAREAGMTMTETHLFPSREGPGYFGTRRFDRDGDRKIHVHTLSGLLHADFRLPSVGYEALLKVSQMLVADSLEIGQIFRRMAFNVVAHNRDDHSKNHCFMMDADGMWALSPAYDLMYSHGPGGEHAMDILGEGRNPTRENVFSLADKFGVSRATVKDIFDEVSEACSRWPSLANECGVSKGRRDEIQGKMAPHMSPGGNALKFGPK